MEHLPAFTRIYPEPMLMSGKFGIYGAGCGGSAAMSGKFGIRQWKKSQSMLLSGKFGIYGAGCGGSAAMSGKFGIRLWKKSQSMLLSGKFGIYGCRMQRNRGDEWEIWHSSVEEVAKYTAEWVIWNI